MAVTLVQRALIQGDPTHANAKMREGFRGSWNRMFDRKTGSPEQLFTIEERSVDASGAVKVLGYYNCVAKGDQIAAVEAAQWSEVELLTTLRWNRDTKYLQLEVVEVKPIQG
jgi:ketosteroid isomerase-like protein